MEQRHWAALLLLAFFIFALLVSRALWSRRPVPSPTARPAVVAVEGDVKEPGIFLLKDPAPTVASALKAAGGCSENLNSVLPPALGSERVRSGFLLRVTCPPDAPLQVRIEPMPAAARLTLGDKLDLNRASEEDLMLLPQMKPEIAAAIVERRRSKPWRSLADLKEIPGVGAKTIEKWKESLQASLSD